MNFRRLTGFWRNYGRISEGALEKSSNTYLRELPVDPRGRHVIVTLDPSKFAEKKQRLLHIGNLRSFRAHIALHKLSNLVVHPQLYYNRTRLRLPYPPDTTAFLYYFTPSEKPRIAGELRLRLASNDDHTSFESGSDLLELDGHPWSRSLYGVSKFYIRLYEKLREDGLVSDDLDAVLSTFPRISHRCQELYTLNDTFTVNFRSEYLYLAVITEQGMETFRYRSPFVEWHHSRRRAPYTGSALVRFERSTLPDHKGARIVVLRFLKIITSAKCVIPFYDGHIVPPKEGELYRRSSKRIKKLNPLPWSFNIDNPKSQLMRGFRLLWDATDIL